MTGVAPVPGPHGGDGHRLAAALGVAREEVLDLSASLNPLAPNVTALVAGAAGAVTHYPDRGPATAALAEAVGVDRDRVLLTNGGAEAIALVAAARPCGHVPEPEFSLYGRHLRDLDPAGPVWRSNPNNPTGRLAGPDEQAAVWDEAFYPLATGSWTRGDDGAVVVGSLTKLYACPGLRLGYCLADPDLIAELAALQPAWAVNSIALDVMPRLLAQTDLTAWAAGVAELRRQLEGVLRGAGLEPDPSDAAYVLVRSAPGVRERLARAAIAVRDTASFGLPGGVRIAVPDAAGLERLATALGGGTA